MPSEDRRVFDPYSIVPLGALQTDFEIWNSIISQSTESSEDLGGQRRRLHTSVIMNDLIIEDSEHKIQLLILIGGLSLIVLSAILYTCKKQKASEVNNKEIGSRVEQF